MCSKNNNIVKDWIHLRFASVSSFFLLLVYPCFSKKAIINCRIKVELKVLLSIVVFAVVIKTPYE